MSDDVCPMCEWRYYPYCICPELRAAYRRGYNAHAAAAQEWRDTHGAYRQPPAPKCPWCEPGGES